MMMNIFAYFLIPAYTILFTKGYGWFTTNFSVIGNILDKKLAFFTWGIMVIFYFFVICRRILRHTGVPPFISRLAPTSLVLLFFAITTPYLPDEMPLKSFLHIVFAFISTVMMLLFLLGICLKQHRRHPAVFAPYLAALAGITAISLILLWIAGIISSALEIFITISTAILAKRLSEQVSRLQP